MQRIKVNIQVLKAGTGFLILSLILMFIIIPGIFNDPKTAASGNPYGAIIGISLAIVIRLFILRFFLRFLREIKQRTLRRSSIYISIGVILVIMALIYIDGAYSFTNHEAIPHVSPMMFGSVVCDLLAASSIIFVYISLKRLTGTST